MICCTSTTCGDDKSDVSYTNYNLKEIPQLYNKGVHKKQNFISIAQKDLLDIESDIKKALGERDLLTAAILNIETISEHAQYKSYIQITQKAYMEAFIKHTGEYHININDNHHCILTKSQTIDYLQRKIDKVNKYFENLNFNKEQINARLNIYFNGCEEKEYLNNMPDVIPSEKGMAFKQGSSYEIIEIDGTPN